MAHTFAIVETYSFTKSYLKTKPESASDSRGHLGVTSLAK